MPTLSKLAGAVVYAPKAHGKGSGSYARLGKVHQAVFAPDGCRVVGFLVLRPDVAGMIKRGDTFVALDALAPCDGGLRVTREDAYDDVARRRLGVDWDACIIWAGMDARTTDGRELGYVNDARFDARTGAVSAFMVGDGGLAQQLVGSLEIPVTMLRGYEAGYMVVNPEAAHQALSGGVAGKAGESYARAKASGAKAAEKAGKAAGEAVDKGSRALGRQLGRTKGMFSSFVEEFKRAQE